MNSCRLALQGSDGVVYSHMISEDAASVKYCILIKLSRFATG